MWFCARCHFRRSAVCAGGARFRERELSKDQNAAAEWVRNFLSQPGSKRVEEALHVMNTGRTPEPLAAASTKSDEAIANLAREGWRELGFWYDCQMSERRWVFRADRNGIAAFAAEVRRFTASPEAGEVGEHAHLGPFSNLRLMCANKREVTWRGIAGRREDFEELAAELDQRAQKGAAGEHALAESWSSGDSYRLVLLVEEEGFDPGAADQSGSSGSGSN